MRSARGAQLAPVVTGRIKMPEPDPGKCCSAMRDALAASREDLRRAQSRVLFLEQHIAELADPDGEGIVVFIPDERVTADS